MIYFISLKKGNKKTSNYSRINCGLEQVTGIEPA